MNNSLSKTNLINERISDSSSFSILYVADLPATASAKFTYADDLACAHISALQPRAFSFQKIINQYMKI